MCTYGRFETVRQSMTFWRHQDYQNKELVIFNTAPVPLELDSAVKDNHNIRVVNWETEAGTDIPYSSLGKIRADAQLWAKGDVYICWDDDDMFLPWHISQGVEKLKEHGKPAWKPKRSYFSRDGGETFQYAQNSMEASILVDINELRKYGFSHESGSEHLKWLIPMRDSGDLVIEEITPFESYAYVWGSDLAPHKTSGNIDHPNNFENHKVGSTDFGEGKKLTFVHAEQVEKLFTNCAKEAYTLWKLNPKIGDNIHE